MTKPLFLLLKKIDGAWHEAERGIDHGDNVELMNALCCGACRSQVVQSYALVEGHGYKIFRSPYCENCGELVDWAAYDKDEAERCEKISEWFDANAVDGSLDMINEEGTGYLQKGDN